MEAIARVKGLHWVPGWSMTGVWGLEDPLASRKRGMSQKMRTDINAKGSAFVEFRAMTPQSSRYNKRRASLSGLLKEVLVRWQRWSRRSML
jgi:hypothetical protein